MKKSIIISGIIIIIIFSIIGIIFLEPLLRSDNMSENSLKAVIRVDKTIARVGEGLNFTAEDSVGQIINYQWDFGDGNISNESSAHHSYEISGWYNVTLNIEDESGRNSNSFINIGVQRHDISYDVERGRQRDLRPTYMRGIGIIRDIGPNIGQPAMETHGEIYQAIGTFDFRIEVWIELPDENWDVATIHRETFNAAGENIQYSHIINPTDLPQDAQKYPSYISISILVDQGRWGSATMFFNAVFPMENLTP